MIVHLVRHGRPAVDPDVPPPLWPPAPDAAAVVAELGASGVLPAGALWRSSPEPKAAATAHLLADGDVALDDDLCEQHRAGPYLGDDEFRTAIASALTHVSVAARPGWEPARATTARARAALDRARAAAGDRPVVIIGHGTALTMLVAELTGSAPDLAAWERLGFPDHCALDGAGRTMAWGRWRRG